MAEAARACSNQRRMLIGSWVTPPTTGAIEIERGGDKNITINHGCSGKDCGGNGNSDDNSDGDGGSIGGDGRNDEGDGGDGGGRESDDGIGGGRSLSPSTAAATGAAKTKETITTITAVAKSMEGSVNSDDDDND